MRFRITERAKQEFEFYLTSDLDMIGHHVAPTTMTYPQGYSALECWWAVDTHGVNLPCREPDLLNKAARSKKSVNLQVKLWAETMAEGLLFQEELLDYTRGWPEWVFRSTVEQAGKLLLATTGFAPRFARVETVLGCVWLPHMDGFDWNI